VPTASPGTNTTQIASVAYVMSGLAMKVDPSQLSATGGSNKVAQYDSVGNLVLTTPRTLADTGAQIANGGNLVLTDRQGIYFMAADGGSSVDNGGFTQHGKQLFRLFQQNNHPYETNIVASGNFCAYWGATTSYKAFQMGDANGGDHYLYFHSGSASAGVTKRQSVPLAFYNYTWTGGVNTWNQSVMQVAPLDTSGTNSAFQFFRNVPSVVQDVEGSALGVKFAEIAPAGVWSAGTAPTPDIIPSVANTYTQVCSKYKTVQFGKLTLGVTNELVISGAVSGMRGVIYVAQDPIGGRGLTMPSGSALPSDWGLSSLGNKIDRMEWDFDGVYYYWTIKAGLNAPLDSNASSFLTATGISDDAQRTAINNLSLALKASGSTPNTLWEKTYSLFPFVGGTELKHRYDLKTATTVGTFTGSGVTHNASGITGDGSTGYFNSNFIPSVSSAQNSIGVYAWSRNSTLTDGGSIFNAVGTGAVRFGLVRSGASLVSNGPNDATNTTLVANTASNFTGLLYVDRSASNATKAGRVGAGLGTGEQTATTASTGNCDTAIYFLSRFYVGFPAGDQFSNANLGAAIITKSLSDAERTSLNSIISTYQTALGR
jgi:hypothetical protein